MEQVSCSATHVQYYSSHHRFSIISRLHSPYLLELVGYCADKDHRLLVYDYMPNGSLQEYVYSDGTSGNPPLLDWATRLRIALDAARGLEYLHECVTPPIIYRDFKSSNILLDENFYAKVSDFDLAKLGSAENGGHVSTRYRYVAPELCHDRNKVKDMVDPMLEGLFAMKDLIQVAAIVAMCVQPAADYRPFMTDVVQSLVPLVKHTSSAKVIMTPDFNHNIVTLKSSSIDSGGEPSLRACNHILTSEDDDFDTGHFQAT